MTNHYVPVEPYLFKTGSRKGLSVERLMFTEYPFLCFLYAKMNQEESKNPNRLQKHLEWILARGENRETRILCPQCGENSVKFFSVRISSAGMSIGPRYTSCGERDCLRVLASMANAPTQVKEFKFSVLDGMGKKERKKVAFLFQQVFKIPRLEKKKIFDFFSE